MITTYTFEVSSHLAMAYRRNQWVVFTMVPHPAEKPCRKYYSERRDGKNRRVYTKVTLPPHPDPALHSQVTREVVP
jgi:hypothetical protein